VLPVFKNGSRILGLGMLTERRRQPKKQAEKNRQQSDANFSNEFPGHGAKRILARRRCRQRHCDSRQRG